MFKLNISLAFYIYSMSILYLSFIASNQSKTRFSQKSTGTIQTHPCSSDPLLPLRIEVDRIQVKENENSVTLGRNDPICFEIRNCQV